MYKTVLTPQAEKDVSRIEQAGIKSKVVEIIRIVMKNPYQNPPPYEKLKGYQNTYSRRINRQHRFVYQILANEDNETDTTGAPYNGIIKIIRIWTHYEF